MRTPRPRDLSRRISWPPLGPLLAGPGRAAVHERALRKLVQAGRWLWIVSVGFAALVAAHTDRSPVAVVLEVPSLVLAAAAAASGLAHFAGRLRLKRLIFWNGVTISSLLTTQAFGMLTLVSMYPGQIELTPRLWWIHAMTSLVVGWLALRRARMDCDRREQAFLAAREEGSIDLAAYALMFGPGPTGRSSGLGPWLALGVGAGGLMVGLLGRGAWYGLLSLACGMGAAFFVVSSVVLNRLLARALAGGQDLVWDPRAGGRWSWYQG